MAAALALTASLLWGSGDFLGGVQSRRFDVLRVLAWSQAAAVVLLWGGVGIGVASGHLELSARAILLGAAGGVAGVIGLASFYRALVIGPMALVPPIAAAGVVIPVAVGLAAGAPPTATVYAGLGIGIIGVVLASVGTSPDAGTTGAARRITPATLGLCLVAACGFAVLFVAVDAAAGTTLGGALLATAGIRCGGLSVLTIALLVRRQAPWRGVAPRNVAAFAGVGFFDTSANLLFAIAVAFGELEIVAVLGSLYPAVTSMLAHHVLGERLGRVQLVGVVVALIGVGLLAGR